MGNERVYTTEQYERFVELVKTSKTPLPLQVDLNLRYGIADNILVYHSGNPFSLSSLVGSSASSAFTVLSVVVAKKGYARFVISAEKNAGRLMAVSLTDPTMGIHTKEQNTIYYGSNANGKEPDLPPSPIALKGEINVLYTGHFRRFFDTTVDELLDVLAANAKDDDFTPLGTDLPEKTTEFFGHVKSLRTLIAYDKSEVARVKAERKEHLDAYLKALRSQDDTLFDVFSCLVTSSFNSFFVPDVREVLGNVMTYEPERAREVVDAMVNFKPFIDVAKLFGEHNVKLLEKALRSYAAYLCVTNGSLEGLKTAVGEEVSALTGEALVESGLLTATHICSLFNRFEQRGCRIEMLKTLFPDRLQLKGQPMLPKHMKQGRVEVDTFKGLCYYGYTEDVVEYFNNHTNIWFALLVQEPNSPDIDSFVFFLRSLVPHGLDLSLALTPESQEEHDASEKAADYVYESPILVEALIKHGHCLPDTVPSQEDIVRFFKNKNLYNILTGDDTTEE